MESHRIVSPEEWTTERKALLAREKELLRQQDELARQRRALPWVKIEKNYVFDGPNGKETLAQLFAGRSQLIVNHFMLGPGWEEGCIGCSFEADSVSGSIVHLVNHDVMYVAVSRAPLPQIEAYHKRMGWPFKWVSSNGSDFNFDFQVSFTEADKAKGKAYYNYRTDDYASDEMPGLSVFAKDETGRIFHTYSAFSRGTDQIGGTYSLLDLTPKGRNEPPGGNLTDWVRRHDMYDQAPDGASKGAKSCCHG